MRRKVDLLVGTFGIGGVERQLLTLARHLDPAEFDVQIVVLKQEGPLFAEVADDPSVAVWSPGAGSGLDWAAMGRLAARWDARGTQVVLATNQYPTLFSRLAQFRARRAPVLACAFHSTPALMGQSWKDRLRLALFGLALRGSRVVVYVSDLQRRAWQLAQLSPRTPSVVIYNGVHVQQADPFPAPAFTRASLGWPDDALVIGLCAQMRVEKRIPDLIEAAALLQARGIPARCLLIGDGTERPQVEARARALLPAGHVHITGFQQDVLPWMVGCDVMALVSQAEAFSIAALEAMVCGKPLVLSEVGGAAEQVVPGETGYLYPVGDIPALADALGRLADPVVARRLGGHGRQRVAAQFSQELMVQGYARLLRDVCPMEET